MEARLETGAGQAVAEAGVVLDVRDVRSRPAGVGHRPVAAAVKRTLDVVVALVVLVPGSLLLALAALAIVVESRGPVFYRAERVGHRGRPLRMLKLRKMASDAAGGPLTTDGDLRLTRIGAFLMRTRLDELPQLWHVLRGEMSLVGPRPEDPGFVAERLEDFREILGVRPGMTGLSQLAFASEREILDPADPMAHYRARILPQKCGLDRLYARRATMSTDLAVLGWTVVAVVGRREVAVNRADGRLGLRRRPSRTVASA